MDNWPWLKLIALALAVVIALITGLIIGVLEKFLILYPLIYIIQIFASLQSYSDASILKIILSLALLSLNILIIREVYETIAKLPDTEDMDNIPTDIGLLLVYVAVSIINLFEFVA